MRSSTQLQLAAAVSCLVASWWSICSIRPLQQTAAAYAPAVLQLLLASGLTAAAPDI